MMGKTPLHLPIPTKHVTGSVPYQRKCGALVVA